MRASQKKLFSLKTGLKEQLGKDFLASVPKEPGIYFFYGEDRSLLYVGKAKELKTRLSSYFRIDQSSPRKLQRLALLTRSLEWETLATEEEALIRENYFLRSYKPPFNRMNVRPESYLFFFLKFENNDFEIRASTQPNCIGDEQRFGCFKGKRRTLESLKAILRIFWFLKLGKEATALQRPFSSKRPVYQAKISDLPREAQDLLPWLRRYLKGTSQSFVVRAHERLSEKFSENSFERYLVEQDISLLEEFFEYGPYRIRQLVRKLKFNEYAVEQDRLDDAIVQLKFHSGNKK